jgi:hypothetical protein
MELDWPALDRSATSGRIHRPPGQLMRWLIIGHSGTEAGDAVGGTPWPLLLREMLAARSDEPVEVDAFRFWPAGARAVPYALERVDSGTPDGVILDLNAYPSTVAVVSESVRQRFGERAARRYQQLEAFFQRRSTAPEGEPNRVNRIARRAARKVLGARALVDIDESAQVFAEVLRGLVQRERIEVFVLSESSFGPSVRRANPGIDAAVRRLQAPSRRIAAEQRIPWIDAGDFCPNDEDGPWAPDHIHLSALGNELYAIGIAEALGVRALQR